MSPKTNAETDPKNSKLKETIEQIHKLMKDADLTGVVILQSKETMVVLSDPTASWSCLKKAENEEGAPVLALREDRATTDDLAKTGAVIMETIDALEEAAEKYHGLLEILMVAAATTRGEEKAAHGKN